MQIQAYLRHAMAEVISEGIINCLIVTNSSEANVQLTRIHEHIFARKFSFTWSWFISSELIIPSPLVNAYTQPLRAILWVWPGDPTVASVWRRQTFSAAVESCTPEMTASILYEHIPELMRMLQGVSPVSGGISLLDSAYTFSRMLHGPGSNSGDAFYRAFVPELGSPLYPRQIELTKRCLKSERGELDRVGATLFPGLVKASQGNKQPNGQVEEDIQVCHMW